MELDLDKYRAEHEGEGHKVTIGGVVYELPAKLPLVVGSYLRDGDLDAVVRVLFGPDAVDDVAPLMTYEEDTGEGTLGQIIHTLYGLPIPESSASSRPSKSTGTRSRPTSKASTG